MYIALIGDVVDSKKIVDRFAFQRKLNDTLVGLNEEFGSLIVAPFQITLGDEFQALLSNKAPVLEIIDLLNLRLQPQSIRWGLGVGSVSTEISKTKTANIDGPAFWYAREAIEYVHKNNYNGNSLTYLYKREGDVDLINSSLRIHDALSQRWTPSQSAVIEHILKTSHYKDYVNKTIAHDIGLTEQRVSNVVAATFYKQYAESRYLIQTMIKELAQ